MFGSKNSELTRKYSSTWFEAITFGFSSRLRVCELPEADRGERDRQRHEHAAAPGQLARRPVQPAQQREEQRERARRRRRPARAPWRCRRRRRTAARKATTHAEQHPLQRARGVSAAWRRGVPRRSRGMIRATRRPRSPRTAARAGSRVLPPDCTGMRNGSTASAATPSTPGRRANRSASAPIATIPTAATASAADRGRAPTPSAASSRSRPAAARASAPARRASPTPARASCARGRLPPPSAAAEHHAWTSTPSLIAAVSLIAWTGFSVRTSRRMSTILRVTWLSGRIAQPLRPFQQPDADHGALAQLDGGEGRPRLAPDPCPTRRPRPPPPGSAVARRAQQLRVLARHRADSSSCVKPSRSSAPSISP